MFSLLIDHQPTLRSLIRVRFGRISRGWELYVSYRYPWER